MNPFCPYCRVMLITKFRTWTVKGLGQLPKQQGAKVWECPRCKRRWRKGRGLIRKGTECGRGKR